MVETICPSGVLVEVHFQLFFIYQSWVWRWWGALVRINRGLEWKQEILVENRMTSMVLSQKLVLISCSPYLFYDWEGNHPLIVQLFHQAAGPNVCLFQPDEISSLVVHCLPMMLIIVPFHEVPGLGESSLGLIPGPIHGGHE